MPAPSMRPDYWSQASQMVDTFMNDEVPEHVGFSEHLHVLDVQMDLRWFRMEARAAEVFRAFPVVTVGDGTRIPISMVFDLGIGPGDPEAMDSGEIPRSVLELRLSANPFGEVQLVKISEAIKLVKERATAFLNERMIATKAFEAGVGDFESRRAVKHFKGSSYPTPVCSVTFHTASPNLRIVRSGAYFITGTPRAVGAPTTPLSSRLSPGTYIFGADQGKYGSAVQWDTAHYSVPATSTVHLSF